VGKLKWAKVGQQAWVKMRLTPRSLLREYRFVGSVDITQNRSQFNKVARMQTPQRAMYAHVLGNTSANTRFVSRNPQGKGEFQGEGI